MTLTQSGSDVGRLEVRTVTDAECRHFREHGWTRLPNLLDETEARRLGERLTRSLSPTAPTRSARQGRLEEAFDITSDLARDDAEVAELVSRSPLVNNGRRLLIGEPDLRLLTSNLLVKAPNGTRHGATKFHQDFPWVPFDRSGMVTFWIALSDISMAVGGLQFLSGSHRFGLLGRSWLGGHDDVRTMQPWTNDLPLSPLEAMRPGDATAHDGLTVHGALPNQGTDARTSLACTYFDRAARYTGAPFAQTDRRGLIVNEEFDDSVFPAVGGEERRS